MLGETVLVIDSDTETTQKIVATLESADYLVFTAASGDVGVIMAKKVNPSVIYINPAMAGTSGLEICKTIHNMEKLKNIPIVILSAFEGATDSRYTAMYGIVDSLKKPFTPEELVAKTRSAIAMRPAEAGEQPPVEEGFEPTEAVEAMPVEETVHALQAEITEEPDLSDKTLVKMQKPVESFDKTLAKEIKSETKKIEEPEEEKTEHIRISRGKPDESLEGIEKTYVLKKNVRRDQMKNRSLLPYIFIVLLLVLGAAGFFLYKTGFLSWTKVQTLIAKKPAEPVKKAPAVPPAQEQPKPEQPVPSPAPAPVTKPAPLAKPVSPALATAPKPAIKAVYSVQIGAFKNAANAEAIAKQYKNKDYDAFVQKGMKGNEAIYRVLVGRFENKKDAGNLAASINTKEKIKGIIYKD